MLYKYCNTDGLDILINSRLRLSRVDGFNDPFELTFGVDEKNAESDIRREYNEYPDLMSNWVRALDAHNIVYDKTSPEDIIQKYITLQIYEFRKVPKMMWESWSQTKGIICMSESMDVIQMWAHYADNHKGIVVGIEEREFVTNRESVITVCYRDKMVMLPVTGDPDKLGQYVKKYVPEVLARKETNWSYEKEIRLYGELEDKDIDGHYYLNIPSSAIREVYLGLRSDDTTNTITVGLKERDEYKHLKVYKMLQHESSFNLNPQELVNSNCKCTT